MSPPRAASAAPRRLRIAIDMDEVMADALAEHIRRYNAAFGADLAIDDLRGRHLEDWIPPSQREAVDRLIAPRVRRGLKVWAAGQWAFLAYAEDAGARALANTPPLPEPGDTIVVSRLDYYGVLDRLPFRRELLNT